MRHGSTPVDPRSILVILDEVGRACGEERRDADRRDLHAETVAVATQHIVRRDRLSLAYDPGRLPDGTVGRTTVVPCKGERTLVCPVA